MIGHLALYVTAGAVCILATAFFWFIALLIELLARKLGQR
jgi:hypothetical protein